MFLTACPGSGKTLATAARVARLASDGRRVAVVSYTNVGVQEVTSKLYSDFGTTLGSEHFVGTLHKFLLQFAYYPFAHLEMKSERTPTIYMDHSSFPQVVCGDNRARLPVSMFVIGVDGHLAIRNVPFNFPFKADKALLLGKEKAVEIKKAMARKGVSSADDSMYWSLRVLRKHPEIARRIGERFDELIIDEAQDTSELQLACIEVIRASGGLSSLVLVGDIEQSIYSFNGASPEGCQKLAREARLGHPVLRENFRSSQKICDVASAFCARRVPDAAVGPDADCDWTPEVVLYPSKNPAALLDPFLNQLKSRDIKIADAAVVARKNVLVDEINATVNAGWSERIGMLGSIAAARVGATSLTVGQVRSLERAVARLAWDLDDLESLDASQRRDLRSVVMEVVQDLPPLDLDLRQWIRQSVQVLDALVSTLTSSPAKRAGYLFKSLAGQPDITARQAFVRNESPLRAQTVHDVKGQTRDAVLVVAERPKTKGASRQGLLLNGRQLRDDLTPDQAEEARIVFVALTRARRYCVLALPDSVSSEDVDLFESLGFSLTAW